MTLPSRASRTAVAIASRSCCPRRTGNAPAASMSLPSGNQYSSDFAMKRRKRCGHSGMASAHGSKLDTWLHASTHPPAGTFSRPRTRNRYSP